MKRIIRNRKKLNGKRIAAAAVAGLSAAAVVMTAVMSDVISAEAADTLRGIEKLRTRYKESGSEFVILEVVPNRTAAEIGYLVGGYEPILCEWDEEEMVWKTWQNTLCALPATSRKSFVENKKQELREYYTKHGLTNNFPVEPVEEEYEEGDPRQPGYEKIVSDGVQKIGWFEKRGSDGVSEGSDTYQVYFDYNGKYNSGADNDNFYTEEVLYYIVQSAELITSGNVDGIEGDRPIYVRKERNVYEYIGTWEDVRGDVSISSISDNSAEDEEEEDESKPDDGKDEDDNKDDENGGSGGSGNGGSDNADDSGDRDEGDDSGDGDEGDDSGDGDEGDDSGNGGDNGDDSGNGGNNGDDSSNGGDNGDDSGDGGDNGDDSGNGEGTGNSGDNGNNNGNDAGNSDGSTGSTGGTDSNGNAGSDSNNVNSGDIAKRTGSVSTALRQGEWFKLVADDIPTAGSDDGSKAEDTSGSQDGAAADDKADSGDGTGSNDGAGTDDSTDSDDGTSTDGSTGSDDGTGTGDNTDSDDNTDTDGADSDDETDLDDDVDADAPAADDPIDEDDEEGVKKPLAEENQEYYMVAFEKVKDYNALGLNTPLYSAQYSKNIVLSENGEYVFIEWDGESYDVTKQKYTFPGREIWCKNTFKSNEWFKKYVLNMDKADYEDFRIKVLTFTPQELNEMEQIPNFDFLYLNSGLRVDTTNEGDQSDGSGGGSGDNTGDDNIDDIESDDGNDSGDDIGSDIKDDAGNNSSDDTENNGSDDIDSDNGSNTGSDSNNDTEFNGNDSNGSEISAGVNNDLMTKVLAADSLQGKWRKLVANDNLETPDGGSAKDSSSEDNGGTGDNNGSESGNDSENNSGTGESNGSESVDGSENNSDTGDNNGSEDNKDAETPDGSGTDSDSEDNKDAETPDGSGTGSDSGDDKDSETDDGSGTDGDAEDNQEKPGTNKGGKAVSDSVNGDDIGATGASVYSADNDLSADMLKFFFDKAVAGAMPCLVDGAILYVKDESGSIDVNEELKDTNIFRLSAMLCQENLSEWYERHRNNYAKLTVKQLMDGIVEDADKNFVAEQVYCRFGSDSIINSQFAEATIYRQGKEIEPGFQCVLDEINLENLYRESDSSGNYKPLSTDISQAKAVRHILNYRDRRKVETKKHVRVLEIQPAMADTPELTLDQLRTWAPEIETADITVMTTAEFIGKIEKLNENFDLIYIGTSKDHLNMRYWTNSNYYGKPDKGHVAAGTVFNDSDMDGLIYYNIGDLRVITLPMAGLLTSEYWNGNRNDWTYFYNYARYGGNDISKEKMNALISFLDGSYPVIIADDFLEQPATVFEDIEYRGCRVNLSEGEYTQRDLTALGIPNRAISSIKVKDGYSVTVFDADNFGGNSATFTKNENNFVSTRDQGNWNDRAVSMIIEREEGATPNRRIDEDHIDNCSYIYEFVKKAMNDKYVNFYAWGDIGDDSELFKFYLNRPKVSLTETEVNGEVEEGSDIYYINPDRTGKYTLQYRFKIQNEGAASYNTRYVCKLYIDVNSDGKFSGQEEIEDITITQNGGFVSEDALYADRTYILTRQVPTGYKGLLPWKVEITQADNENIYTSMSGYTKLNGMDKEVLKICQINKNGEDVINLNYEVNTKGRHFNTLVYGGDYDGEHYTGISDEFELDITTIDINTFQNRYYANNEYLKDFNMLILGFSDMYGDFAGDSESGPMGAIVDFINSGKSVLLGHDTTSFFNSPDLGQGDQAMKGYPWRDNHNSLIDIWWYNEWKGWYYTRNASTLNKYVRPLVGMDRYGILDSDILQRGDILRQGSGDYETVVNSGKDVAYKPKSGKKETVPEVHGYTYQLLSAKDQQVPDDENNVNKYVYSKWNLMSPGEYDGVPDNVFENKYTNIRYDAAWYWNDVVESDPARYGELERVNNGEVNGIHATQVNKGQITEYPYKLKDEFEVAITHGQYYELDYTADDDGDGQSDLVVWYCLGERTSNDPNKRTTVYSQSPNDVRNNYYIYNKGNITYTGMGHARCKWGDAEWYTFEEAKLFINTMIASYQAGIKDPQISVLKSGVQEAEEMKLLYRYYDSGNNFSLNDEATTDAYEKIYFTVQDINFIKGTRKIESHVYYKDDNGGEVINVDGEDIRVNRLADSMCSAKDGSAVDAYNLTSGGIYYIQVPRDIMKKCEDGLELYFEAQSTITTNTTKVNVYTTEKVYAKLQVLQAYLFNLE